MTILQIGGAPEHFNLPWNMAIDNGEFVAENVDLNWRDFQGGTGAMCEALRDGSIDIAVLTTEGIIKDIVNGNPSKIIQTYVNSPLQYGIHVAAESTYVTIEELENKKAAISRIGSESQLAVLIHAKYNNWNTDNIQFETVGKLLGGIDALTNGTADYFLGEHFMSKPMIDNGTIRRLGNHSSQWPSLVIAVRDEIFESNFEEIKSVLKVINKRLQNFSTQAKKDRYVDLFSQQYHLEKEDVKNWLIITDWNQGKPISRTLINKVQNKLLSLNVIDKVIDADKLIKKIYL